MASVEQQEASRFYRQFIALAPPQQAKSVEFARQRLRNLGG
jgi:hypothetical protein